MNRRKFILAFSTLSSLAGFTTSCVREKHVKGTIIGASSQVGHLLRDKQFTEPDEIITKDVVIIGGGVSGLSAARALHRSGIDQFILLDLESKVGGNAASGSNAVSAYPWGAHYVPIPNNNLAEYMEFLEESGVITGSNENGLPVYNEYYLCFDPQERLYINGRWQEGLIPQYGVPSSERIQVDRFLNLMETFRHAKGKDGKEAFALPVNTSSKDAAFTALDKITMKAWLQQQELQSNYLAWYINYCTRDDFGTPFDQVSAWAGIHYFASRKGMAANAEHGDVLTWPSGNGWLVAELKKNIQDNIQTGALAVSLMQLEDGVLLHYFDVGKRQLKGIKAKQCILAIPQFVACRLLHDKERQAKVEQHFQYSPWMVANLTVNGLEERGGAPLSWDNVRYDSPSLGYVEATHELVQGHIPKRNLTYYLPLTKGTPADERKAAQSKTHAEWVKLIFDDLEIVHPNIREATEEINIMLWGHAMAQPLPGLIHGTIRNELGTSIGNVIHFAHTDLAGVSLFEEAFYQGLAAAEKVTGNLIQS